MELHHSFFKFVTCTVSKSDLLRFKDNDFSMQHSVFLLQTFEYPFIFFKSSCFFCLFNELLFSELLELSYSFDLCFQLNNLNLEIGSFSLVFFSFKLISFLKLGNLYAHGFDLTSKLSKSFYELIFMFVDSFFQTPSFFFIKVVLRIQFAVDDFQLTDFAFEI